MIPTLDIDNFIETFITYGNINCMIFYMKKENMHLIEKINEYVNKIFKNKNIWDMRAIFLKLPKNLKINDEYSIDTENIYELDAEYYILTFTSIMDEVKYKDIDGYININKDQIVINSSINLPNILRIYCRRIYCNYIDKFNGNFIYIPNKKDYVKYKEKSPIDKLNIKCFYIFSKNWEGVV